jgi:hypothetical protein
MTGDDFPQYEKVIDAAAREPAMRITLGPNQYGKTENRVVRLYTPGFC